MRDDCAFRQVVAMSAIAAERDRTVVVAGRLDCRDLHPQAALRAGDVRNGRIGLMRERRRHHDRTPLDVRLRAGCCARSESGTTHFSVTIGCNYSGGTMANRHRGEIEADIGGARRRLVLTLGALAELEDVFGAEDLVALTERFGSGRLKARDLARIIGAGLRGAGAAVTDDDVAAMAAEGGAQGYVRIAAELIQATFGEEGA